MPLLLVVRDTASTNVHSHATLLVCGRSSTRWSQQHHMCSWMEDCRVVLSVSAGGLH